jgi:CDP-diglyceride synthetase
LFLALIAATEFLLNEGHKPDGTTFWVGMLFVLLSLLANSRGLFLGTALGNWAIILTTVDGFVPLIVMLFLITGMGFALGKQPPAELFAKHSRLVWGILYIGLLYPYVYAVGESAGYLTSGSTLGGDWLLFLFGLLWIGDTAAMGIGSWLGRHKLAPGVSPNKTIEGFVGGLVGSVLVGVLMSFWRLDSIPLPDLIAVALGCSLCGQLGDLVESMWKRSLGIKDSSALIPGHGGMLDRFDSLLFAAPFMYLYMVVFL